MSRNISAEGDELEKALLPPTRADWVEQQLRRDILTGVLVPGQRLLAADLAKQYAVSPTPLREALQRLATTGLVDMTPQRGVRVAPLSVRDAIEIYELRCVLEPLALRKSLAHRDDAWREKVQRTYRAFIAVFDTEPHDPLAGEVANRTFHRALLSCCDSHWLLNMVEMLTDRCVRYRLLSLDNRGGKEGLLHEHDAIYDACMRGDIEAAAHGLEQHIRTTLASITDKF